MSSVNLGRVQGAGIFYSSAASGTGVALSTVTPTSVKPLAGDTIVFSNGDLRTVTGISGTTITCGEIVGSIKGTNGTRGSKWSTAESIPMPDGSQSAGDQFLTTGADNNGNVYEWGGQWILKGNIKGADAKFYIPLLSGGIGPAGTKPTSVSTGSFGTASNWSDNKAGEVGDVFNCIFENTVSGEVWFCTGVLTNATSNASFTTAVKIGNSKDSVGYTGTFELPTLKTSANDIIMDSITFTETSYTFTSVGVTPVVGLPVSGIYRRTTNNRLYKWIGTITQVSGSTITITATGGAFFITPKYQHNIHWGNYGSGESGSTSLMLHFSVITNSATPITSAADAISAVYDAGATGGPYGRKALPATGIYKEGTTKGNIYCVYSTGGPSVTIQICTPEYQYNMITVNQTLAGIIDDVVIEI